MKTPGYILLTLASSAAITAHAEVNADRMLAKCTERLNSAPSVTFTLAMTAGAATTYPTLTISKDKYHLTSPEMDVWYDGRTMWVYVPDTREVTISEPTADELMESNPVYLLQHATSAFATSCPAGAKNTVDMTARSKSTSLRKASVTINNATNLPGSIDATMSGNQRVKIKVVEAKIGKQLPASTFIYNPASYPAAVITDLR